MDGTKFDETTIDLILEELQNDLDGDILNLKNDLHRNMLRNLLGRNGYPYLFVNSYMDSLQNLVTYNAQQIYDTTQDPVYK